MSNTDDPLVDHQTVVAVWDPPGDGGPPHIEVMTTEQWAELYARHDGIRILARCEDEVDDVRARLVDDIRHPWFEAQDRMSTAHAGEPF